MNFEVPIV